MGETGVLKEGARVELLNGEIIDMSPIGKDHSGVVNLLAAWLHAKGQGKVVVSTQNPILLDDHSEPEPDLAVLRFRADYYRKSLARPEDVTLLIEVADSSLYTDRQVKIPLYAAAGIAEVWIVDLNANSLELFRDPVGGQFRQSQILKRPAVVAPKTLPSFVLKLDDLFPD